MGVCVRPSVRPSGNALIAKTVAISKVKASCAKHSLGRGAPLAPRMPSIEKLELASIDDVDKKESAVKLTKSL